MKDRLLLRDVQVVLLKQAADDNEDGDGVWACINWSDTKRVGLLQVCTEWEKLRPDVKTECIVHELIHLLLRDVDDMVTRLQVDSDMGARALARWKNWYDREMEMATHQLTRLLMMTVPEWPGEKLDNPTRAVYVQRQDEDSDHVG